MKGPKRCLVTNNPCGTDTWKVGHPCQCENCRKWMEDRKIADDLRAVLSPIKKVIV